jgi:hypothetical protein
MFSLSYLVVLTYDLERVGNNADSHELLSVVTAVHHQRVGETLDDRALRLSESLLGISTGGVGDVDRSTDLNVIAANLLALLALLNAPSLLQLRYGDPYVKEISRISTSS